MTYVHYRADTPQGHDAQLHAIAILTAGLDSDELLQQELTEAIGRKPDAAAWTLLTIALAKIAIQATAFAAAMDADNVDVVSGSREQVTSNEILQDWAQLTLGDGESPN